MPLPEKVKIKTTTQFSVPASYGEITFSYDETAIGVVVSTHGDQRDPGKKANISLKPHEFMAMLNALKALAVKVQGAG